MLDATRPGHPDGLRDRAALVLGFTLMGRCSESAAFAIADVTFTGDGLELFPAEQDAPADGGGNTKTGRPDLGSGRVSRGVRVRTREKAQGPPVTGRGCPPGSLGNRESVATAADRLMAVSVLLDEDSVSGDPGDGGVDMAGSGAKAVTRPLTTGQGGVPPEYGRNGPRGEIAAGQEAAQRRQEDTAERTGAGGRAFI